jgi:hypothetical protein
LAQIYFRDKVKQLSAEVKQKYQVTSLDELAYLPEQAKATLPIGLRNYVEKRNSSKLIIHDLYTPKILTRGGKTLELYQVTPPLSLFVC